VLPLPQLDIAFNEGGRHTFGHRSFERSASRART
jgi:hypothetical protein